MDYRNCDPAPAPVPAPFTRGARPVRYVPDAVTQSVKIVVAGAFGVGKTTLVDAVSEIEPLHTEERMTTASAGTDSLAGVPGKSTTTVVMDFGRIRLDEQMMLYLFGTPGQSRFWPYWSMLVRGAVGAVILVDPRYLERSFEVLDLADNEDLDYVVAVNLFPDTPRYAAAGLGAALGLREHVPLLFCDVRDRASCREVLIAVVRHAIDRGRLRTTQPGIHHDPGIAGDGAFDDERARRQQA